MLRSAVFLARLGARLSKSGRTTALATSPAETRSTTQARARRGATFLILTALAGQSLASLRRHDPNRLRRLRPVHRTPLG